MTMIRVPAVTGPTMHDHDPVKRLPGTGEVINNSLAGIDATVLGYVAPIGDVAWAWITLAGPTAQAGTADTETNAVDAVLDTWVAREPTDAEWADDAPQRDADDAWKGWPWG